MKFIFIYLFIPLVFFTGFTAGAQNVFYNEMRIKAAVKIEADELIVYTSNSIQNSALLIYRIYFAVDEKTKSIFISASQAVGRPYQTKFSISFKKYGIKEPQSYRYYWVDPDRKRNQLAVISEGETEKYNN